MTSPGDAELNASDNCDGVDTRTVGLGTAIGAARVAPVGAPEGDATCGIATALAVKSTTTRLTLPPTSCRTWMLFGPAGTEIAVSNGAARVDEMNVVACVARKNFASVTRVVSSRRMKVVGTVAPSSSDSSTVGTADDEGAAGARDGAAVADGDGWRPLDPVHPASNVNTVAAVTNQCVLGRRWRVATRAGPPPLNCVVT